MTANEEEVEALLYDTLHDLAMNREHPVVAVVGRVTKDLTPFMDDLERGELRRGTTQNDMRLGVAQACFAQGLAVLFAPCRTPHNVHTTERVAADIYATMLSLMVASLKESLPR